MSVSGHELIITCVLALITNIQSTWPVLKIVTKDEENEVPQMAT